MKNPALALEKSAVSANEHTVAADEIRALREAGKLDVAIGRCRSAIAQMPTDPFFPRILADLFFERGSYDEAFVALADYLAVAPLSQRDHFAKRYARFRRVLTKSQMERNATLLDTAIGESSLDKKVADWARSLVSSDLPLKQADTYKDSPEIQEFLSKLHDGANFEIVAKLEKEIERKDKARLLNILDAHVLDRARSENTYRIDLFCASIYERNERHEEALKILSEILKVRVNFVAARALFRICRIVGKYDLADELLRRDPALAKTDEFNVLYELAFYYEANGDFRQLNLTLKKIEKRFGQNLPVLRTVRNFYIRFGLLDDAQRLEPLILGLYKNRSGKSSRFLDSLAESDAEVTSKMQQLYSELEHQKQLAAISDLTTGISHELGQPITNIRYTIQFYKRILEKKLTKESVFSVFDSILEETKRMGGLIGRLSPLTSSKAVFETFDVMDRIQKRIQTEQARLQEGRIAVKTQPKSAVMVYGDPVKFDQLISNLLLNSVDAIHERKEARKNEINILVSQTNSKTFIEFSDTGIGIPLKNRNTIFDPFFTTKPPGKGEGLGLFIVWNLLKMQGGTIAVDADYNNGAKFRIQLPAGNGE